MQGDRRSTPDPEVEDLADLDAVLSSGRPLTGLRFQDLDLTAYEDRLLARTDVEGLVVLGGRLSPALAAHLGAHRALVFPTDPHAPVDPYRATLYTAGRALRRPRRRRLRVHTGLPCLPVDAGRRPAPRRVRHAAARDPRRLDQRRPRRVHRQAARSSASWVGTRWRGARAAYAAAARLGRSPRRGGTGRRHRWRPRRDGGRQPRRPRPPTSSRSARPSTGWPPCRRSARPSPTGSAWRSRCAPRSPPPTTARSLGIPTWFYGHEPPNVFCDGIGKYFSNAIREDGLLARATAGLVVLEGAAGTVQEIFQAVTPLFYAPPSRRSRPLVLVGQEYWSETVPVWAAVRALGQERGMEAGDAPGRHPRGGRRRSCSTERSTTLPRNPNPATGDHRETR